MNITRNVNIDKLDNVVDKYNSKYHTTIKMKLTDVKLSTYIRLWDFLENDNKDPKFRVASRLRISKYKNIFAKGYAKNWSDGVFVIKILYRVHAFLMILTVKQLLECLIKQNCKRETRQNSRLTK